MVVRLHSAPTLKGVVSGFGDTVLIPKSSRMVNKEGTTTKTSTVDAIRPKARLVTSGIRTIACKLVSVSIGNRPTLQHFLPS